MTNEEELTQVEAEIAALSATILSISGKTNQSVSFGDQTYSLANLKELNDQRDRLRARRKSLESILAGGLPRRTIKIGFPTC